MKCPICRNELRSSEQLCFVNDYSHAQNGNRLSYEKQSARKIFKKRSYGKVLPHVCLECGYVAAFMEKKFHKFLQHELRQDV